MLKDDPSMEDSLALLERLVGYDTTSNVSNLDLINDIAAMLSEIGVECRLTFNDDKNKANLWATIGPQDRGGIILSGHTDVVPVEGQDWSSDPFKLVRKDERLFGRGTCDMKGFVACALSHARLMQVADLKTPIHFAFSYDEELGCLGVGGLIKDMTENLPAPMMVIVGEPTNMQIVGGHKGGYGQVTTVHGLEGHSSAPHKGVNAIFFAARILNYIEQLAKRMAKTGDPDNGFSPHHTTVDCGLIEGGTAGNIIPGTCTFAWGFRNIPGDDPHIWAQEVYDFIEQEIVPEMKAISPSAGVSQIEPRTQPAFTPSETSAAETLLRHLTGLNHSNRVSYGTEASHFQAAGVPGVVFGPGSIEQAHMADEYLEMSQLKECHDFIGKLANWAASNALAR